MSKMFVLICLCLLSSGMLNAQVSDTLLHQYRKDLGRKEAQIKSVILTDAQTRAMEDFNKGYALNTERKYQEAIPYLMRAIDIDSTGNCGSGENGAAFNELGFAHTRLRQYEEALKFLNIALRINPAYTKPYLNKSNIYQLQQKLPEAIETLEALLKREPALVSVQAQLGTLYEKLPDYPKAKAAYQRCLELAAAQPADSTQTKMLHNIRMRLERVSNK